MKRACSPIVAAIPDKNSIPNASYHNRLNRNDGLLVAFHLDLVDLIFFRICDALSSFLASQTCKLLHERFLIFLNLSEDIKSFKGEEESHVVESRDLDRLNLNLKLISQDPTFTGTYIQSLIRDTKLEFSKVRVLSPEDQFVTAGSLGHPILMQFIAETYPQIEVSDYRELFKRAIVNNSVAAMDWIRLKVGAGKNVIPINESFALASSLNPTRVLSWLQSRATYDKTEFPGRIILQHAAVHGHIEVLQWFLHNPRLPSHIIERAVNGAYMIRAATEFNQFQFVIQAIGFGCTVDEYCMDLAVAKRNIPMVNYFWENGLQKWSQDAVLLAIIQNKWDCFLRIRELGCPVTEVDIRALLNFSPDVPAKVLIHLLDSKVRFPREECRLFFEGAAHTENAFLLVQHGWVPLEFSLITSPKKGWFDLLESIAYLARTMTSVVNLQTVELTLSKIPTQHAVAALRIFVVTNLFTYCDLKDVEERLRLLKERGI